VLILGCLLAANAAAWVIFLQRFQQDPKAERLFCRFGICDTNAALSTAERLQGGDDAVVALEDLREFLIRDPAGSYRWVELGDALHRNGQIDQARYAFGRAVTLAPKSPPTLLGAATFHFELKEDRPAPDLISRSLKAGSTFDREIFADLTRRRIPVDEVLWHGLPDGRSSQAYLRHLFEADRPADADAAWNWIFDRGHLDGTLANEYVEFLLRHKKPEAAATAWARYAGSRAESPDSNIMFNGDFELDTTGSRFDWRIDRPPGTTIDFDEVRHSGRRSLRIRLDGDHSVGELGVQESVFVKPGRYRFRAYVRTQQISTDQGLHFRVVSDDDPKQLDLVTDDLRGSNDWTLVERVFDAPPRGGLVRILLARKPSLKFYNRIGGTAWIDDVSLTEVGTK